MNSMVNIKIYKIDKDYYVFNEVYDYPMFYTFTGRDIVNDMWAVISVLKDKLDNIEELTYNEFVARMI